MRRILAALFLLVCPIARAHHLHATAAPGGISPCTKFDYFAKGVPHPDFQKVDWPAIKGSAEAKLYFSQGITQYYGFNYEEAMRNFKKAKEIDAKMAMASWGIALAAGPNINLGMATLATSWQSTRLNERTVWRAGRGWRKI
jgi:hypothetical protein